MGRLIDDEKLKAHYSWWKDGTREMTMGEAKDIFDDIVDLQPTADAVEVVRCKDCKFYRFYDGTFGKGWMCFENNTARHGDDFCSRGRKKNDRD